jgi:transposase
MYVAGIDGHATYLVVVVVNKAGELVEEATRIANQNAHELVELLERFRPLEAVVETSPAWPWLHDMLTENGFGFVLAHAKKLRAIAEANYKRECAGPSWRDHAGESPVRSKPQQPGRNRVLRASR